ncbi:VOC family protein [Microvirga sp. 2TAF3]|uniref:VOC family protein n=1 Tax=Microvirga sp. 2TAF3 TaxID=3233014 RepID=UPI003F98FA95
MKQNIGLVTLIVRDYDEAIRHYTTALQFDLIEDTPLDDMIRWVRIAPRGSTGAGLLLVKAATPEEEARIGNQVAGRVALFLYTDDFRRDYENMRACGVAFHETPREEAYGTVAVFEDLYGNLWDLIQPKP